MKNLSLLFISVLFSFIADAQLNGSVKGKLTDTTTKQPLSDATVSLLSAKDSSLVTYSLSDKKGFFEIKNLDKGTYQLLISFTGFEPFKKSFSILPDKKSIDFGEIILEKEYKTLSGVVVTDNAPVKINGDTISFKADAFKTKPNGTVEDVLKKLPGVLVQKDGTVSAMGENVQKVYVDGKEFFGNDPKMATKNIAADMVDQIQVYDDMSEQAKFTKIDDGSRSKTINIKLKKDRNRGDFGRIIAGGGTDGRYEGNLSFNHFSGSQRISLVSSANNTNKQNFTFSDASSQGTSQFTPGGGGMSFGALNMVGGGGGNGISSPRSAGINYNDQWGKKIDFRMSYNISHSDNLLKQTNFRQATFPGDSISEVNTNSESRNRNKNHRVNARWEYNIDSMNSLLFTANMNLQKTNVFYNDTSFTFSKAINDFLAVTAKNNRTDDRNGTNYSGDFLYRKKFKMQGRTLTMGWRNGYNENESDGINKSPITAYRQDGSIYYLLNQDQQNLQDANSKNNTLSASYTEPLGKNKIIEFNYAYSGNNNTSDRKTFNFNTGTGKYDQVNIFQTNFFEYKNTSNRIGTNFRISKKKYNYQLGMGIQSSELKNRNIRASTGKDTTITQRFTNFFPTANFNYNMGKSKNIRIFYRGRTNAPSVSQLQDVPDLSNPLQIKTGNPSLKQEFNNSVNINYNTFQLASLRFINVNVTYNTTRNKIVNSVDSGGGAILITRPENTNGSFNTSGFFTVGFPVKKIKGANINLTTMGFYSSDPSLLYNKKIFTQILNITQMFGFNYSKGRSDMGITGSVVYSKVNYELQKSSNTEYFKQSYSADITHRFKKEFYFLSDLDYYINSGRTSGFNQNIILWNVAAAKKFLKNNAAEIKLTAYDVLNQNKGINRNIGDNYFEDIRANVVPRFFLLSLTYNINHMANKNQQGPPQIQKMLERGVKVFQ